MSQLQTPRVEKRLKITANWWDFEMYHDCSLSEDDNTWKRANNSQKQLFQTNDTHIPWPNFYWQLLLSSSPLPFSLQFFICGASYHCDQGNTNQQIIQIPWGKRLENRTDDKKTKKFEFSLSKQWGCWYMWLVHTKSSFTQKQEADANFHFTNLKLDQGWLLLILTTRLTKITLFSNKYHKYSLKLNKDNLEDQQHLNSSFCLLCLFKSTVDHCWSISAICGSKLRKNSSIFLSERRSEPRTSLDSRLLKSSFHWVFDEMRLICLLRESCSNILRFLWRKLCLRCHQRSSRLTGDIIAIWLRAYLLRKMFSLQIFSLTVELQRWTNKNKRDRRKTRLIRHQNIIESCWLKINQEEIIRYLNKKRHNSKQKTSGDRFDHKCIIKSFSVQVSRLHSRAVAPLVFNTIVIITSCGEISTHVFSLSQCALICTRLKAIARADFDSVSRITLTLWRKVSTREPR